MTRCIECNIVDLGVTKVIRNESEYLLCPNCGADDTVEEIDELDWVEDMVQEDADFQNELNEDYT